MDLRSQRLKNLPESATIAMAVKARAMRQSGIDVISLSLGEPDFKTPDYIVEGTIREMRSGKYFGYPPVAGYLDLREAISNKFSSVNNLDYSPDQIVVSNGAKQSLANVFLSIIDPGDEVIVYTPYWVSYTSLIQLAGGTPVFVEGGLENDFKAPAAELEKAITDNTKAIIFSSPCNPTGSVFLQEELEEMAAVLQKHPNIVVIADEIYEVINFSGAHASIGTLDGMQDRTVTVNGFSKGFAMTGWRVGYIGAPQWLAKAAVKIQGQITSANSSIAQRAGFIALTGDSKTVTDKMANAYRTRRDFVHDLLSQIPGFKVNQPLGAFYFFPDISAHLGKGDIQTANDFCMYILNEAKVSLVSGEAFGAPDCIRISYAASEDNLRESVSRIRTAVEKLD